MRARCTTRCARCVYLPQREVLEWPCTAGGGGVNPPPKTKGTIEEAEFTVGKIWLGRCWCTIFWSQTPPPPPPLAPFSYFCPPPPPPHPPRPGPCRLLLPVWRVCSGQSAALRLRLNHCPRGRPRIGPGTTRGRTNLWRLGAAQLRRGCSLCVPIPLFATPPPPPIRKPRALPHCLRRGRTGAGPEHRSAPVPPVASPTGAPADGRCVMQRRRTSP